MYTYNNIEIYVYKCVYVPFSLIVIKTILCYTYCEQNALCYITIANLTTTAIIYVYVFFFPSVYVLLQCALFAPFLVYDKK